MAQRLVKVSQVMEFECDGCGFKEQFDLAVPSAETERKMAEWFIIKKMGFTSTGEPVEGRKLAHSLECVPVAATKAQFIAEPEEDPIDLNSLRAGQVQN